MKWMDFRFDTSNDIKPIKDACALAISIDAVKAEFTEERLYEFMLDYTRTDDAWVVMVYYMDNPAGCFIMFPPNGLCSAAFVFAAYYDTKYIAMRKPVEISLQIMDSIAQLWRTDRIRMETSRQSEGWKAYGFEPFSQILERKVVTHG